jgi:cytochrome P450
MKTSSSSCPFHVNEPPVAPLQPLGAWPPGPASGVTGWGLLRSMSKDILGSVTAWQKVHGEVVHLRIWPEHQIIVTDPALARELLVSHHHAIIRWERGMRVFSDLHGHSVFIAEGQAWRNKRHGLQKSFSPKTVNAMLPAINASTERAFDRWPNVSKEFKIEAALTALTMDVIMNVIFSSDIGDDARSAELAVRTVIDEANAEMFWPVSAPNFMPWKHPKRAALATLNRLIDKNIKSRLNEHQTTWPDDLLSAVLRLHQDDKFAWPMDAVRDECMTAFLAGHEAVAATLTWWAWCMASNPTIQAIARLEVNNILGDRAPTESEIASLSYLKQTLEETLRLYPSAPMLNSRRSTLPITLGGWQLPAGTMFMLPIQLMHHDPRWFPDPLSFKPERFAADAKEIPRGVYIPFGVGPRVCLGLHVAMTEMIAVAAMILQRFTLSVPLGESPPQPVLKVSLRPKDALELEINSVGNLTVIQ